MEYFFAYAALAVFVGFIAKRVHDARKARQENTGGGGTYVPRKRNDEFER
jgi:hypothetical protein